MVKNGKTKRKYHKPTKPHHHSNQPAAKEEKPTIVKTLPADLLLEILYRTAVKSLVRCTCVCKSWFALIHHPTFIKMHLDFNRNNQQLLCINWDLTNLGRKLVAFLSLNDPPIPVLHIDPEFTVRPNYPRIINFPDFSKNMSLVGSINGIVCLANYIDMCGRFVALWNPAINYWNPITLSKTRTIYDILEDMSLGFGFDAVADDFKIICIVPVALPPRFDGFGRSRVEIYSANQDIWEDVDKGGVIPFSPKVRHCNFIVKGVPYWIGIEAPPEDMEDIPDQLEVLGRIDPFTGLFKKIQYPEHIKNQRTLVHPVNLRDSVTVLIQSPGEHPNQMFDLYVRDQNTAKWTKMYSIGPFDFEGGVQIPRCFSTGEIILETWKGNSIYDSTDHVAYICDPKNSTVLHNEIDMLKPFWFVSCSHVESLVCLKGMVQIGKERRDKKTNPKMKNWIEFLSKDFESSLHL